MMKIYSLVLLIILFTPSFIWSQFTEEDLELNTGNGLLKGTLTIPEGKGKFPLVLIIAGSGPTDRNGNNAMMTNNSLRMLAEGLSAHGIGSFRFDKRGVAESASTMTTEADLRFETYVEDVVSWARLLQEDPRLNELIILGHSEGSLLGMIAAQKVEADKFISLAGVGRPAAEILREQLSDQPPVVKAMTDPILDTLEMGQTVSNVNPMLNSLFRPSVQPYLISWFRYDPVDEIAKLECPVLIVQGTTDIQVQVKDAELLATANPGSDKVILERMNHVLKNAPPDRMVNVKTYYDPSLPLKAGLMETLVEFIQEY